jgi:chloramphenicol O-acetyltransferase
MKLKKKKADEKEKSTEKKSLSSKKFNKLDAMQMIDDLKASQEVSLIEGNLENSIKTANKIIELAIRYNMNYYIKEQEDFLKAIADKEQKNYFTAILAKEFQNLKKLYDNLMETNQISQAHSIVQNFKQKHIDNPILASIPSIKVFLENERINWIKFQTSAEQE